MQQSPGQVRKDLVFGARPLFDSVGKIGIIKLKIFRGGRFLAEQHLFEWRAWQAEAQLSGGYQKARAIKRRDENCFSRAQRSMEINLAEHVVARLEILLNRE